jgi:hypothetical protein
MVGYIFPGQHPQQIHPHAEQPPVGTAKMVHQANMSSNVTMNVNVASKQQQQQQQQPQPQRWATSDASEVCKVQFYIFLLFM